MSTIRSVEIYDTTLRDGSQTEEISFSVEDKLRILSKLDETGIHYVEGGWPGAIPKDDEFFRRARRLSLKNTRLVVFGATRKPGIKAENDAGLKKLLAARCNVVTLVGKAWMLHVKEALKVSPQENIDMIFDSIEFLKRYVETVFFDAEHFFDGYKDDSEYAVKVVEAARSAGADCIVLCDTNGGCLPWDIQEIVTKVKSKINAKLGIHCHNDSGTGVANSIAGVLAGVTQVQGTINGIGERCGNANLCTVIPDLKFKLNIDSIPEEKIKYLKELASFVSEIANLPPDRHQPYVGDSAFAHKGGLHVSGIARNPRTYEHIDPALVGNQRKIIVSEQAGRSNIIAKLQKFGLKGKELEEVSRKVLERVKLMEQFGYHYEGADASFEILVKKALNKHKKFFKLRGFRVIDEKHREGQKPFAEATIMVEVGGKIEHTAAVGNGPVNALDNALRKALEKFYPSLANVRLLDYKVRVLTAQKGTAASVRVLIESGDGKDEWGTVGVSENIIEASWIALVDSIEYKLMKDEERASKKFD